jgi:hypothetical protein
MMDEEACTVARGLVSSVATSLASSVATGLVSDMGPWQQLEDWRGGVCCRPTGTLASR